MDVFDMRSNPATIGLFVFSICIIVSGITNLVIISKKNKEDDNICNNKQYQAISHLSAAVICLGAVALSIILYASYDKFKNITHSTISQFVLCAFIIAYCSLSIHTFDKDTKSIIAKWINIILIILTGLLIAFKIIKLTIHRQ